MKISKKNILKLIRSGESETVEFKSSFDQAAIETIVAFAQEINKDRKDGITL